MFIDTHMSCVVSNLLWVVFLFLLQILYLMFGTDFAYILFYEKDREKIIRSHANVTVRTKGEMLYLMNQQYTNNRLVNCHVFYSKVFTFCT